MRIAALLAALCLATLPASAADGYWAGVATDVANAVAAVEAKARAGDQAGAMQAHVEAYFGQFENRKMEAAMRKQMGIKAAADLELKFGKLRKAARAGDLALLSATAADLREALAKAASVLDAAAVPPQVYDAK